MDEQNHDLLQIDHVPDTEGGTLILAFDGWMDGGDVSTGTVGRLVDLLEAEPVGEISPDPFYIYNFPGPMEVAALFRPAIVIDEGRLQQIDLPSNSFYWQESARLALFVGKEPNLRWPTFGDCLFQFVRRYRLDRLLFVGSFGGNVPHTREPRLYVTGSDAEVLTEMSQYAVGRTAYAGPGSFSTYLMNRATADGVKMASLVAEIPSYVHGPNPTCIEAVTRRLAKILQLSLDLDSLRSASTEWEIEASQEIEKDPEMVEKVRELEQAYDDELLQQGEGE